MNASAIAALLRDIRDLEIADSGRELACAVPSEALRPACAALAGAGARFLTMVGADEREAHDCFTLRYYVDLPGGDRPLALFASLPAAAPNYPSCTPALPAADWDEREMRDLLGLIPREHPDRTPLFRDPRWPDGYYPLRKDAPPLAETATVAVATAPTVFGPLRAGSDRLVALSRTAPGEIPALQFFHGYRGVERRCEQQPPHNALALVERICGSCTVANALAFCRAIEGATSFEPHSTAIAWREALLALDILRTHLLDLARWCDLAGRETAAGAAMELHESLLALNAALHGRRLPFGILVPGGLATALSATDARRIAGTVLKLAPRWAALAGDLRRDRVLRSRARGRAALPAAVAERTGALGLIAEACGMDAAGPIDVEPAEITGIRTGDCEARLLARLAAIERAIGHLTRQLEQLAGSSDGPYTKAFPEVGGVHAIGRAASARGDHVLWVALDRDGLVERLRIRSASYASWPAVPFALQSATSAELPLILAGFSLCTACVDR